MAKVRLWKRSFSELYVAVLFTALSLFLIYEARGGAPFVFDGNETFSSLIHARNTVAFGPGVSAGLADESTSLLREGHAVVHSHQGNFPRLYASLIYVLGASSPEAQVLLTSLPVGVMSVLMLFYVLRRVIGGGGALVSMTILLTDYVLFTQWQVVTYRVWYTFFFAAAFFSVERWREKASPFLGLFMFAIWVGLFYFELVFAVFLATSISVYTLWRLGGIRQSVTPGILQFLGALTGISLVVAQVIIYLGWDGFLTDLNLTYLGRNLGNTDIDTMRVIKEFVELNNIAFFYNFIDSEKLGLRSLRFVLDIIFKWGFQVYTPALISAIIITSFGVLIGIFACRGRVRRPRLTLMGIATCLLIGWIGGSLMPVWIALLIALPALLIWAADPKEPTQHISATDAAMLVGTPALILILLSLLSPSFLGFSAPPSVASTYGLLLALGAIVLSVKSLGFSQVRSVPLDAIVRAAGVVTMALVFIRYHANLYDENFAPIWVAAIPGPFFPVGLQRISIFLAVALAAALAANNTADAAIKRLAYNWRGASVIIASCFAGLTAALIFSPGYIYSGYMVRYNNFMNFVLCLFVGMVFYSTVVLAHTLLSRRKDSWSNLIGGGIATVFMIVGAGWWISVQVATYLNFPPNGFAVLEALRRYSVGRSLIATSYPAPFSLAVGNWAYLDHSFAEGKKTFSPKSGWSPVYDYKYRWFADRNSNPDYDRPSTFVCFTPFSYGLLAQHLQSPAQTGGCGKFGLVKLAQRAPDGIWPNHRIVAADTSGRNLWTIVDLDWDFSPILRRAPDVQVTSLGNKIEADVAYAFFHQDGAAELGTEVELRHVTINGATCKLGRDIVTHWTGEGGRAHLVFPLDGDSAGGQLIVGVRPRTATRSSDTVYSRPFVTDGRSVALSRLCTIVQDENDSIKIMDRGE